MSTIPKENRNLPVPYHRDVLTVSGGQILTAEQRGQVDRSVQTYLRDHRLPVSFHYYARVVPVVRVCIQDGLNEIQGDATIQPGTRLDSAYRAGAAHRTRTIRETQREINAMDEAYDTSYQGIHAVPAELVKEVKEEIMDGRLIQRPWLVKSAELLKKIEHRKPIYKALVDFARKKAEAQIPGSRRIKLTREQEEGIVRNLVFSWVALGEPFPIIELEDIVAEKDSYARQVRENGEELARGMLHATGQSQNPEAATYIYSLMIQLEEYIRQVEPRGKSLADIEYTHRKLTPFFGVVAPFYKYINLTENESGETSIWTPERSVSVEIQGARVRMPTPATLKLLAFVKLDTDRERAIQLRRGAGLVKNLAGACNQDSLMHEQEERVREAQAAYSTIRAQLLNREIPAEIIFTPETLAKLITRQQEIMDDEEMVFDVVRDHTHHYIHRALNLLVAKYQDGRPAESPADVEEIKEIFAAGQFAIFRTKGYMRSRVHERLREFQRLYTTEDPDASEEDLLAQARRTTIIDLLQMRSDAFLDRYSISQQSPLNTAHMSAAYERTSHLERALSEWNRNIRMGVPATSSTFDTPENAEDQKESLKLSFGSRVEYLDDILNTPSMPAKTLIFALAKLSPEEVLAGLTPEDLVTSESTAEDDENDAKPLAIRDELISRFDHYLTAAGMDSGISKYAKGDELKIAYELEKNARTFTEFYAMEAELRQWYAELRERLYTQAKSEPVLIRTNPIDYVRSLNRRFHIETERLRNIAVDRSRRINELIRSLEELNLLKREPSRK